MQAAARSRSHTCRFEGSVKHENASAFSASSLSFCSAGIKKQQSALRPTSAARLQRRPSPSSSASRSMAPWGDRSRSRNFSPACTLFRSRPGSRFDIFVDVHGYGSAGVALKATVGLNGSLAGSEGCTGIADLILDPCERSRISSRKAGPPVLPPPYRSG
jgi:hypothetical protein